ncbi:MAG: AIR synthase related protein [Pseudomonadota bacterium]
MEFDLIRQHFQGRGQPRNDTRLAVGDDAALLDVPAGATVRMVRRLAKPEVRRPAGTTSTVQEHFTAPSAKLMLDSLLAELPACAEPAWALLAISTERPGAVWLADFAAELDTACTDVGVELVGGDTTRGADCVELMLLALEWT